MGSALAVKAAKDRFLCPHPRTPALPSSTPPGRQSDTACGGIKGLAETEIGERVLVSEGEKALVWEGDKGERAGMSATVDGVRRPGRRKRSHPCDPKEHVGDPKLFFF